MSNPHSLTKYYTLETFLQGKCFGKIYRNENVSEREVRVG